MKRLAALLCTLATLAACIPDDRGNFMVDDRFGVTAADDIVISSVHAGSYTFGVAKNGIGRTAASASLSMDSARISAVLDSLNTALGTAYELIPSSYFTLSGTSLSYSKEDVVKEVTVSWNAASLSEYIGSNDKLVMGVCVESQELGVNPSNQVLLLRLLRSEVSLVQKSITRVIDRTKVEPDAEGNAPQLQETVILDLRMDNAIKNTGLSYPLKIDNSLISSYEDPEGLGWTAAPEGLVTLQDSSVSIPEGKESATFRIVIDKSVLLAGGLLQPFPGYLVPVTIDKSALKASKNGEEAAVEGLSYGNDVVWVAVSYQELKQGLSVNREWGFYSSEAASWSDYISGFTAGADRNVTLDDNWVYIAETNQSKNLWAISRTDPGNYRKLPVGTVADEGTFYISCPRILPNSNPDVNGGKDVLVVSSMATGDPKLYVYADGTDADPSVLSLQTWASRRLGDTFTYWGSLQEGMLFFKDFDSAQGTVTFKLSGRTAGNLFLVGRIVAPPVTGAGAYFPFPDNISAGVSSSRGGSTAWLTRSSTNLWTLEGPDNSPTLTELSDYFADTAFRFFELGGKRYIAYTRQVSSTDGRLFILEGESTQSWEEIITERNVVYHAAIQNDTEQDGVSEEPSPRASTHSGMDLDVRVNGNEAYIAVVKQNVGLSLFRMMYN